MNNIAFYLETEKEYALKRLNERDKHFAPGSETLLATHFNVDVEDAKTVIGLKATHDWYTQAYDILDRSNMVLVWDAIFDGNLELAENIANKNCRKGD